jgi:hypothetical protein
VLPLITPISSARVSTTTLPNTLWLNIIHRLQIRAALKDSSRITKCREEEIIIKEIKTLPQLLTRVTLAGTSGARQQNQGISLTPKLRRWQQSNRDLLKMETSME